MAFEAWPGPAFPTSEHGDAVASPPSLVAKWRWAPRPPTHVPMPAHTLSTSVQTAHPLSRPLSYCDSDSDSRVMIRSCVSPSPPPPQAGRAP